MKWSESQSSGKTTQSSIHGLKRPRKDSDRDDDIAGSSSSTDVAGPSRTVLTSPSLSDSVTTSDKDTSADSADPHESEIDESRWNWCEYFRKREGKVSRRYIRCEVCTSYPSVVALHAHRQRTPPIATIGGTRYREEVVTDHEKHACHEAAVRAKRQHELWKSDPLSVPLIAGLRHMEDLFHKVGSFILDVYYDAQRGTLSAGSWPSWVLVRYMADELKIDKFEPFQQPIKFSISILFSIGSFLAA